MREYGPSYLSNSELIAILLRTGVTGENVLNLAVRLLSQFQGLAGLARTSYGELCSLKGISDAKACQLLASLELGRRLVSLQPQDRAVIRCPDDVANLLSAEMSLLEHEHLRVLLLDTKNRVTGSVKSISETSIRRWFVGPRCSGRACGITRRPS